MLAGAIWDQPVLLSGGEKGAGCATPLSSRLSFDKGCGPPAGNVKRSREILQAKKPARIRTALALSAIRCILHMWGGEPYHSIGLSDSVTIYSMPARAAAARRDWRSERGTDGVASSGAALGREAQAVAQETNTSDLLKMTKLCALLLTGWAVASGHTHAVSGRSGDVRLVPRNSAPHRRPAATSPIRSHHHFVHHIDHITPLPTVLMFRLRAAASLTRAAST